MDESTLKKLRLLPVAAAIMMVAGLWWWLRAPDPSVLIFSTGSPNGLYHRLALQLKTVIEASHPNLIIELQTSVGSRENIKRLDDGQAHLALVQNDAFGGQSVRSVAALYPEVLHLLCHTNAGIRSLNDLSEKRIGIGPADSGTEQIVTNLLAFANLAGETSPSQTSFQESIKKLESSELDAAFFLVGLGTPVIDDALKDGHLIFADIHTQPGINNTSAMARARQFTDGFRVRYPHVVPHTIPMMVYAGHPASPVPSLGVQAVLVAHHDIPAAVVERITRTLFEQRAVLSQRLPVFTQLDEQAAQSNLQFPVHDGAQNFYRRREPGFFSEYAEIMGLAITVVLLLWSILIWAKRWYSQGQKNRIDSYYEDVEDIIRRLQDSTDLREIDELEAELLKIRQRASAELVKEQLAADESYIIYQNMLNGCQTMLVRMREKIQASPGENA
jgi:TRAP transporter TAXI family solute receptor